MSDNHPTDTTVSPSNDAENITTDRQPFRTLLKDLAGSSVIFFAAAYLIGSTYNLSYFTEFRLNSSALDLPATEVAADALQIAGITIVPIFLIVWLSLAMFLWIASSPTLSQRLSRLFSFKKKKEKAELIEKMDQGIETFASAHAGAIAFAGIFFVFWVLASVWGTRSARDNISTQKNSVRIAFKDPQNQKANVALMQSSDSGNLGFVIQTKDLVVLFDRHPGSPPTLRNTYILSRSDLAFFEISSFHGRT